MSLKRILFLSLFFIFTGAVTVKLFAIGSGTPHYAEPNVMNSSPEIETVTQDLIKNMTLAREAAQNDKTGYLFSMHNEGYDIGKDFNHNENYHSITHVNFSKKVFWNNNNRSTVVIFKPDGSCEQIPENFIISVINKENQTAKEIVNNQCTFAPKDNPS